MQRQRSELVPIGEALSGIGGPVKAIREATPQSLHHFTQADLSVQACQRAVQSDHDCRW